MKRPMVFLLVGLVLATASSCTRPIPEAIPQPVQQFMNAQVEQNRRLADLQQQWQRERQTLFEKRDALEVDRAELAKQRAREPVVAAAITAIGELALCLLPLAFAWLLLRTATPDTDVDLLADVLLTQTHQELLRDGPGHPPALRRPTPGSAPTGKPPHLPSPSSGTAA